MSITIPFHQFEIRYTKLLNFSTSIQEAIAPFIPMAIDIQVDSEDSNDCKYNLIFDGYNIFVSWDRVIIKYDGEIKKLRENNSIIDEPFFNLFSKIKELQAFGNVINCLCVSIIINHTGKNETEIVDEFIDKLLVKANTDKILSKPSDVCIILNKDIDEKQISIQYGPYIGVEDLKKRIVLPQNREVLQRLDKFGEMAEVKIFETLKTISFAKYKEHLKMTLEYQKALWNE